MLNVRIIPCLDVNDNCGVKGVNFALLQDAGDPVEQAKLYDQQGANELCFLDISVSHENRHILFDTVKSVAEACFMPLTVGGGVKSVDDIRKLLLAGADKISINSAAIYKQQLISDAANKFGEQCVVIAIDARKVAPGKFEVFMHGGREPTGLDTIAWAEQVATLGAGEILLTSMDFDGAKQGYDLELLQKISHKVAIPVRMV